ncbi:Uncharacterised protein [BD1-7 clade bacterium]|uniref:BIG2 domain-containing protein n=1 Tax=BD1-7 clade bacterium TaxID=2029982 RepID=A0A5S9N535_9GAMM|nr:Uncharacterised protein [BD1-7 clade bacterium]
MHSSRFTLKRLALACAVSAISTACSDSNTQNEPTSLACMDTNLSGTCSSVEQQEVLQSADASVSLTGGHLFMQRADGLFLTAPASTTPGKITPFTTLVQSELIHNPLVWDETQPGLKAVDKVVNYLNQRFPGHDFATYLVEGGPEADAALLQASFMQAVNASDNNRYCSIAAAVDAMVEAGRFDVEVTADDIDARCQTQTAILQRVNDGFKGTIVDFDSHFQHNIIVAATSDDEIKTWPMAAHIKTPADADLAEALAARASASQARFRAENNAEANSLPVYSLGLGSVNFDDDNDYDFDYDDDDDYDSESGASGEVTSYPTIPTTTDASSKGLSNIARVVSTANPSVLFTLTNDGSDLFISDSTLACADTGSYGVYRINLNATDSETTTNTTASAQSNSVLAFEPMQQRAGQIQVDTLAGASVFVPVDPVPADGSDPAKPSEEEASCLHDDLTMMALSDNGGRLLITTPKRVFSLDAVTLEANGSSFTPFNAEANLQSIDVANNNLYAAIVSDENDGIAMVNLESLSAVGWPTAGTVQSPEALLFFDNNNKGVAYENNGNELIVFNLNNKQAPEVERRITLDSAIAHVAIPPNKQFMVVLTQDNKVRSYLLPSLVLNQVFDHVKTPVTKLKAMNDAVILLEANNQSISTLTYQQGLGSPMSLAAQTLTDAVVLAGNTDLTDVRTSLYLPQSFSNIDGVAISWSSTSSDINTDTGAITTTTTQNAHLTATISGEFRGEATSMQLLFPLVLKP